MSDVQQLDPREVNIAAGKDDKNREALMQGYPQVCDSYRAIDDTRMKLLGLLPLATGGLFVLTDKTSADTTFLGAIGAFGFVITLGLFAYELHGIKKCGNLIRTGQGIENSLGFYGQFRSRPHDVAGFIDEPFAASLVYPASLAAWAYLVLAFAPRPVTFVSAIATFVIGFVVSLRLMLLMEHDLENPKYDSEGKLCYVNEPRLFHRKPKTM